MVCQTSTDRQISTDAQPRRGARSAKFCRGQLWAAHDPTNSAEWKPYFILVTAPGDRNRPIALITDTDPTNHPSDEDWKDMLRGAMAVCNNPADAASCFELNYRVTDLRPYGRGLPFPMWLPSLGLRQIIDSEGHDDGKPFVYCRPATATRSTTSDETDYLSDADAARTRDWSSVFGEGRLFAAMDPFYAQDPIGVVVLEGPGRFDRPMCLIVGHNDGDFSEEAANAAEMLMGNPSLIAQGCVQMGKQLQIVDLRPYLGGNAAIRIPQWVFGLALMPMGSGGAEIELNEGGPYYLSPWCPWKGAEIAAASEM